LEADRLPQYCGPTWDEKISDSGNPNFWKYGVANLVFLDFVREKKLVLDVGCGTGGLALFLAEQGAAELIVGVDALKSMIDVAKANAFKKGSTARICFVICDGRHMPFKSSCVDALVSRGDAFCFLIPLENAVHEFKRVLSSRALVVLEMDNRRDWKPNSKVSSALQKMPDGRIAYLIGTFDSNRDHISTFYFLDPKGRIAQDISADPEFVAKGHKACVYPVSEIVKETIEIKRGVLTHWPTVKELLHLFTKNGYEEVEIWGAGLLMTLLLQGEKPIVEAMKKEPELFFKMEYNLIHFLDPDKSPSIILKAVRI
jgi:ubiquinone/menaquinone biosynthesis C-methylase UbiE